MAQFSKTAVLISVAARMCDAARRFREATGRPLDAGNGTAQLVDEGIEAAVAYGEWYALMRLDEAIHAGEVRT